MSEPEVHAFPVIGYDDKGELLEKPIGYLTQDDLEVINRSRGTIKDPNGFEIVTENIPVEDFTGKYDKKKEKWIKEPTIDISKFVAYTYPQPEQVWVKVIGRIKKPGTIPREPEIMIYYNDLDKVCYLHNLLRKTVIKYSYTKTIPTDQELLEFQLLRNEYINFLKQNDMDVEISNEGEMMNPFKIIDSWSHTGKVDVFSRITEEQRKNIILARWIAATTWMPAIFTQIKGFLRLGQSIDEKGPLGKGRTPLIDVQGAALKNRVKSGEDEEQSWTGDKR